MDSLRNKIIVVTGGSGLLGKSILDYLQAQGATTLNAEINVETDFSKSILECDITNEHSVKLAISSVVDRYGRIDGWVNNAYPRTADWGNKFEDISLASWQKNVDMQMNSIFICCQAVLGIMKEQGAGSVVNMSSVYGVVGPDFTVYNGTSMTMPAAYSAIKGGMVNFSRYLAAYYGPYGVRINCVSPGGIFDNQNPLFVSQYENKVPLRRMGKPSDIAPAVGFLLSGESSYITGQNLMVDGGWTSI